MTLYRDREGKPLTIYEWALKLQDSAYRTVAQDFTEEFYVSTIWIGFDSDVADSPMLYETQTFPRMEGGYVDYSQPVYTARHETEKEAVQGHKLALEAAQGLEQNVSKASSSAPKKEPQRGLFRRPRSGGWARGGL